MKDFLTRHFKSNILRYLVISYFSVVFNLILNILTIKYLNSRDLGSVTLGKSIFQSFSFSHFGIRFGLDRHLPNSNSQLRRTEIFGIAYFSSMFFSLVFVIFWFFYTFDDFWFYCTFYFSGFLNTLIMIYRVFYRAENVKSKFINISLIVNLLPIVFQIIGLFIWGILGLIIGGFFGHLICFLIVKNQYGLKIEFRKIRGLIILKRLFNSGIVLFVSAGVTFFSTIGDRFFIEGYWGLEVLGVFSVIMFVFSVFNIFAVNYTEMIMNKIVQTRSFRYVFIEGLKLTLIICIFVLISYFLLPSFVKLIIPQYVSYTAQMKDILIGAIPFSCLPIFNHYLHSIDKRKILLVINIFCTSIYFILLFIILKEKVSLDRLIFLKNLFYTLISLLTVTSALYFSRKISYAKEV